MMLQDFRKRFTYDTNKDRLSPGGFADVFKALDNDFEEQFHWKNQRKARLVALKFFKLHNEQKYTLEKEVNTAVRLNCPHICRYWERISLGGTNIHGDNDIQQVAVIEYLDGGHIDTFLKRHPKHLDKLLIDVLLALDYLHRRKIIHRDIKPSNVLGCYLRHKADNYHEYETVSEEFVVLDTATFNQDIGYETLLLKENSFPVLNQEYIIPAVKVTDFGISKSIDTSSGISSRLFGSKPYMAPEQIDEYSFGIKIKNEKNEDVYSIDTRVDIWSFGVMAYELITGKKLFDGIESMTSDEQVRKRILGEDFLNKIQSLEPKYKHLMEKCLVRKAENRCNDVSELIRILKTKQDDRFKVHYEIAQQHFSAKEYEMALVEIQKSLALKSENDEAKSLLTHLNQILEESQKLYQQAVDFFERNDYEKAQSTILKALNTYSGSKPAQTLKTRVDAELQKTREFKKEKFEQYYGAAQAHFRNGEFDKAKAALENALEIQRENKEAQELLTKIKSKLITPGLQPAAKHKRILNGIVDLVFVMIVSIVITALIQSRDDSKSLQESLKIWGIVFMFADILYYTFFESINGRTLGKIITKTVVVDKMGNGIDFETAFARSLVRSYFAYIDFYSLFGKRVFHDVSTLSCVVNVSEITLIQEHGKSSKSKMPNELKYAIYIGAAINLICSFIDFGLDSIPNLILQELPGIIAAIAIYYLIRPRGSQSSIPSKDIIYSGGANYFLNGEAIGGKLYLEKDSLLFKSHPLNMQDCEKEIKISKISSIQYYNVSKLVPTGLEFVLADGTIEKFVVNKRNIWKENIEKLVG